MKIVKVKPFGVFKVTDNLIDSVEKKSTNHSDYKKAIKDVIKNIKKSGSGQFLGIIPSTKELFSFIPIIENEQFFAAQFPDPIQLYFSSAYANYQFSKQTRHNITFQKSQATALNFVNEYLYNCHLQYKISTIIFLHSTIEAFLNYLMPEDFIYIQEYNGEKSDKFLKQTKEFNKEQTERYILFKEKLNGVVPQLTKIDFQKSHQKIYDKLQNLNTLRNDLIHLRSVKDKNQQYFEKVFDQIVNINLSPFVTAVKDFINIIKPNFIELQELKENKKETKFHFNFESHSAFKLDISIFLKILEVPSKKIILSIPKSNEKNFQFTLNWIMQNLDIMAKNQLIYFPSIKDKFKDKIEIEIIKTDKQLGLNPDWDK
jgi:hypothetical protein